MRHQKIFLVLCLVVLLFLSGSVMNSPPTASADAFCGSARTIQLNSLLTLANTSTQCLEFNLSPGQAIMTIKIEPKGGIFDLYLTSGPMKPGLTLTTRQHKLNFFAIGPSTADATFAFQNMPEGPYVIALVAKQTGNSPTLLVKGSTTSQASASECSGSNCDRVVFMMVGGELGIGVDRGSQVSFPVKIICPGPITATFSWSGTAKNIQMALVGPGSGISNVEYERRSGASPLTVRHNATFSETEKRDNWWIVLSNLEGGTANGDIKVNYPNPDSCPQGFMVDGKITMLRINEVGDGYGPPETKMDVEVVIRLDSGETYGFQLRNNANKADHQGMLDVLRAAFNQDRRVRLEYHRGGTVFRAAIIQ